MRSNDKIVMAIRVLRTSHANIEKLARRKGFSTSHYLSKRIDKIFGGKDEE